MRLHFFPISTKVSTRTLTHIHTRCAGTIKQSVKHVRERQFDRSLNGPFITMNQRTLSSKERLSQLMRVLHAHTYSWDCVVQRCYIDHCLERGGGARSGDTCVRLWLNKPRTHFYFEDVRACYPSVLARAFRHDPDLDAELRSRAPKNNWERDLLLYKRMLL